jgi:hypothetical protein
VSNTQTGPDAAAPTAGCQAIGKELNPELTGSIAQRQDGEQMIAISFIPNFA